MSPEPQPCVEIRGRTKTFASAVAVFICCHLSGAEGQTRGDWRLCCFPAAAFLTLRLLPMFMAASLPLCICKWVGWSNGKPGPLSDAVEVVVPLRSQHLLCHTGVCLHLCPKGTGLANTGRS